MSKKIELNIGQERVRAVDLGGNTAEISDLTMSPEYSYGDIVMYNDDKEVTFLVKKVNNSGAIMYDFELSGSKGVATKIINHFNRLDGIKCEPMVPGFIIFAYPAGIPETIIKTHASNCPVKVRLNLFEDEYED